MFSERASVCRSDDSMLIRSGRRGSDTSQRNRRQAATSARLSSGTGNTPVASSNAATTVLKADENFALSENPVRHGHVIFNFSKRPTLASVYSLSGRRVADLLRQMTSDGRVDWTLKNDDGGTVANGIYLVVFNVDGQVIRQKLFIARPQE